MWCLPQRLRCQSQNKKAYYKMKYSSKKWQPVSSFVSISFVPFVGSVGGALYTLPWILAVVIGIVMLMSSFGNASCLVMGF